MSTQFTNRQWRLPNNENKDKQSNYSMDFDTSSTHIEFSTIQLNTTKSVSLWVNFDSTISGVPLGGGLNNYYPAIGISGSNTLFYLRDSTGFSFVTYNNLLNANQWYHICITGNGTTATFYLNGSLIGTLTDKTPPLKYINTENGSLYGIVGKLDAVSIFNYALTDGTGGTVNQIAALYGSSSTGIGNPMSLSPAPVAYYPLGDQDAFNGAEYLVPNSSLKDYVFDFTPNDYISLSSDISLTGSKTVSFWFKADNINGNNVVIGGNQSPTTNYYPYITSTSICLRDSTGFICLSVPAFSNNVWYHLCIVGDGTTATVYINGQSQGTLNDKSPTINTIGAFSNASSAFDGELSNVQIFNTTLPATGSNSVETLYNNGSPLTSMSGFTSLQGWWKLDASATYDGTDWTIPDDSSNSNDGTSSGMSQANLVQSDLSFTSGYSPYALDFDGANDYIDCGNSIYQVGTGDVTISAWANTSTTASGNVDIFGLGDNSVSEIRLQRQANKFGAYVNSSTASGQQLVGATTISTGQWYSVILVKSSNVFTLYLNGVSDNNITWTGSALNGNGGTIAAYFGGGSNRFNGSISNVSVWNAGLTSAQVSEIYSEGVPQNLNNHSAYSNLVSWWQLGSNSSFNTNWTVLDEKGSNNGTSANMIESDIVDGVNSYANGLSSAMGGDEIVGSAPFSDANSLSVNMDVEDRTTDTPS